MRWGKTSQLILSLAVGWGSKEYLAPNLTWSKMFSSSSSSFNWSSKFLSEPLNSLTVKTPGLQNRKMGKLKLKNGLNCVLISDPETATAGKSLSLSLSLSLSFSLSLSLSFFFFFFFPSPLLLMFYECLYLFISFFISFIISFIQYKKKGQQ